MFSKRWNGLLAANSIPFLFVVEDMNIKTLLTELCRGSPVAPLRQLPKQFCFLTIKFMTNILKITCYLMAQCVSWLNLALELITNLSLGQQFWGSKIMMHNKSILVGNFTSPTYDKLPPCVNPQEHNFWQLIKRNQPASPTPNLAQLFEVLFGNSKKDVSHKANLSHHKKQTNKLMEWRLS